MGNYAIKVLFSRYLALRNIDENRICSTIFLISEEMTEIRYNYAVSCELGIY